MLRRLEAPEPAPAPTGARLELGEGDYEVEEMDLSARYGGCGCTGAEK